MRASACSHALRWQAATAHESAAEQRVASGSKRFAELDVDRQGSIQSPTSTEQIHSPARAANETINTMLNLVISEHARARPTRHMHFGPPLRTANRLVCAAHRRQRRWHECEQSPASAGARGGRSQLRSQPPRAAASRPSGWMRTPRADAWRRQRRQDNADKRRARTPSACPEKPAQSADGVGGRLVLSRGPSTSSRRNKHLPRGQVQAQRGRWLLQLTREWHQRLVRGSAAHRCTPAPLSTRLSWSAICGVAQMSPPAGFELLGPLTPRPHGRTPSRCCLSAAAAGVAMRRRRI